MFIFGFQCYLPRGHKIDSEGIHPIADKTLAIKEAPVPTDLSQLRSYLGLLNYYHKFLPNLSTVLAPIYKLLNKKTRWSGENNRWMPLLKAKKCYSKIICWYTTIQIIL